MTRRVESNAVWHYEGLWRHSGDARHKPPNVRKAEARFRRLRIKVLQGARTQRREKEERGGDERYLYGFVQRLYDRLPIGSRRRSMKTYDEK